MDVIDWTAELDKGVYDSSVGIKILKLAGDAGFSTYLTEIAPGVAINAHYHRHGDEHYHIVSGRGEMRLVDVATGAARSHVVAERCSFVVPANTQHQLSNTGAVPLVLMFSCPASHLGEDRHFL
jgi:mannose-6-phosphate isomerase-like protein (cupin superfamily)